MAKKTLLNEATIRRFMGLAGLEANVVTNHLNENYGELEEDYMEGEHAEAMHAVEALADLEALVEPLAAAAGLDMEDAEEAEPEMDMADAADDMDDAADAAVDAADDMEDAADAAPAMMDDDELVMEVAKRVARRILKARKAQAMLDEALGND
jgi:hypothetical protein